MPDLVTRFPVIARLLLGGYQDAVGQSNAGWLELRLMHSDWLPQDIVRFREMMPRSLWWLLRDAGDDEL